MSSRREQLLEIMEDAAKGETKATLRDRIAELAAENERLKRVNNGMHDEVQFMRKAAKENRDRYEALSRTGAVKVSREDVAKMVYEGMSWAAMCGPTPNGTVPVWEDRGNSLAQDEARRIADRILSALEPATPDAPTNLADVDAAYQAALDNLPAEFHGEIGRGELDRMVRAIVKAHDSKWERRAKAMAHHHHSTLQASIVASKPAAPGGWQEAEAWLYDWTDENGTTQTSADTHKIASVNCKPARNYRPLFTRPSEQAVTEAAGPFITFANHAVEKTDDGWVWRTSSNERICDWFGPSDFAALKAAMEAGR